MNNSQPFPIQSQNVLGPRIVELGPHPERRLAEAKLAAEAKATGTGDTLLSIEVKVNAPKTRHYILWSVLTLVFGLSVSYGFFLGASSIYHDIAGIRSASESKLAADYSNNDPQGSDDSTSTTTEEQISGSYSILNTKKTLSLSSTDYLIGDIDTGDIILEKNGTTKSPMASVTKLMTATVELETVNQFAYATVTPASTKYYPLTGDLVMNEVMKISDLKYPLLVVSSNVAAEVFANYVGREKFLKELNDKAESLGMAGSHYNDPSGLDPKSYSTPEDLFKLARYIKNNHSEIFDIGRIREYSILGHTWINQNHQLTYSTFSGGKNGFTDEAEKTTVSLFSLPFNKTEKRSIAIVLLHTNDREGDIQKILSYISSNVRYEQKSLDVGSSGVGPAINNNNPDR